MVANLIQSTAIRIARNVGPPHSQNLAMKRIGFLPHGRRGGFDVKFLAATFPGNSMTKICKHFRRNFAAFFARVSEKYRLNFAVGDHVHKETKH